MTRQALLQAGSSPSVEGVPILDRGEGEIIAQEFPLKYTLAPLPSLSPQRLREMKLVQPRSPETTRVAPTENPISSGQVQLDPILTTRQVAAILGVSSETVKKWRQRAGRGPEYIQYPGGLIGYRLSTIMHFLQDFTVEP